MKLDRPDSDSDTNSVFISATVSFDVTCMSAEHSEHDTDDISYYVTIHSFAGVAVQTFRLLASFKLHI